eukprot:1953327-Amphidinium_carterae.1
MEEKEKVKARRIQRTQRKLLRRTARRLSRIVPRPPLQAYMPKVVKMKRGRKEEERGRKEKTGRCDRGDKCVYAHIQNPDGTPQKVAQEVLDRHDKKQKDRQERSGSKARASMITADAGISIAH